MKLDIVSFNIRYRDDKNGHSIKERAPRLRSILDGISPDLIGFQEYRPAWEKPVADFFGGEYGIFNKYRTDRICRESTPILWKKERFELKDAGYFRLSSAPDKKSLGWDITGCPRICVFVRLREKNEGREFVFFNTHFGFSDNCQIKSARLIRERVKPFENLPVFITGDFNMTPDTAGYKEMTCFLTDVNKVTANDFRATYHGYHPEKNKKGHIDYCFINGNVKAVSQRLLDQTFDGKYPSDHFGLETAVEI